MRLLRVRGKVVVDAELRPRGAGAVVVSQEGALDVRSEFYALLEASEEERSQLRAAGIVFPVVMGNGWQAHVK